MCAQLSRAFKPEGRRVIATSGQTEPLRLVLVQPTAEGLAVLYERLTGQVADVEKSRLMLEKAKGVIAGCDLSAP